MQKNRHFEIKEFGSDEYSYWIDFKNLVWPLIVSRRGGSILFLKGSIHKGNFDRFEMRHNSRKIEIYINTTDSYGSHCDYVGETEDYQSAEKWISTVNQFYENRKTRAEPDN